MSGLSHAEVVQLLSTPPAPGFVRIARVNGRAYTPGPWFDLPDPFSDRNGRDALVFARMHGGDYLGDWQCAACAETFGKWWPPEEYVRSVRGGCELAVLDVPAAEACWCGTQWIYSPDAAKRVH